MSWRERRPPPIHDLFTKPHWPIFQRDTADSFSNPTLNCHASEAYLEHNTMSVNANTTHAETKFEVSVMLLKNRTIAFAREFVYALGSPDI